VSSIEDHVTSGDTWSNLTPFGGVYREAWPRRTSFQIVECIMELIYSGRLKPGERIDAGAISTALGVSRSPVREALLELRRAGVLYGKFHRAVYVSRFDKETVYDSFDLYGVLWARCTTTVTTLHDEELLEKLRQLVERLKDLKSGSPELGECISEYRRLISHNGGSDRTRALIRSFRSFIPTVYRLSVPALAESLKQGMVEEFVAIRSGDAEAAGAITRRLYDRQGEIVVADLQKRGVIA
jgi:DNA-binding GntR family transcriptional regulator